MKIKKKNVVFCVFQLEKEEFQGNHINTCLEALQNRLKEERCAGVDAEKAFAFHNRGLYARDFADTSSELNYYMDYFVESKRLSERWAKFSHIWIMGHALLEKKIKADEQAGISPKEMENLLYLITDVEGEIDRVEQAKILGSSRFKKLAYKPILIRNGTKDMGDLETYFREKGEVIQAEELKNTSLDED